MKVENRIDNVISAEMVIASSMVLLVGLFSMAAWFVQGDTLLGTLIQQGLAWCI